MPQPDGSGAWWGKIVSWAIARAIPLIEARTAAEGKRLERGERPLVHWTLRRWRKPCRDCSGTRFIAIQVNAKCQIGDAPFTFSQPREPRRTGIDVCRREGSIRIDPIAIQHGLEFVAGAVRDFAHRCSKRRAGLRACKCRTLLLRQKRLRGSIVPKKRPVRIGANQRDW
jgi:hypothetical protein